MMKSWGRWVMASEWSMVRLGDLLRIEHGWPFKSEFFSVAESDMPTVVSIGNFRYTGGFRFADTQRKHYVGYYPPEYVLTPGEILLIMTCQTAGGEILGIPARIPSDGAVYLHNQRMGRVKLLNEDISLEYLYYLFLSKDFNQHLVSTASGTKILHTSPGRIEDFRFPLPSIDEQKEIGALFGMLDARVDLLESTNKSLEEIARAIFKSWFVDFDPVRAKAEGREPEGMDASTAALFPSELQDSELGQIPKGWSISEVKELCSRVINGATPSRANPAFWSGGSIPWFKTGELSDGHLLSASERISEEALARTSVRTLPRNSVIMAIYAAPTVGRLGILTEEAAFNQACTGMVAASDVGHCFLFQTLQEGRSWFNNRANGAAQQNISKGIVESYKAIRPSIQILASFNVTAEAIYDSVEHKSRVQQSLTELRDTLLPRLISGKLRIPEAEKLVEGVL